jgi:hypothetical protein
LFVFSKKASLYFFISSNSIVPLESSSIILN